MALEYFVIDAFTDRQFAGNPAGVVLDADGLTDAQMQAIAAEFNLAETTFILPPTVPEASLRFRWFTPTLEVNMCGHATIAGLRALVDTGRIAHDDPASSTPTMIETRSGVLATSVESIPGTDGTLLFWLDLPKPVLRDIAVDYAELGSLLGLGHGAFDESMSPVRTQDEDLILFVRDFQTLNEARPEFGKLGAWQEQRGMRGLCLATTKTLTPSVHVQSRFFAPAAGINEDPVTGSAHGPLTAYLASRGLVPVHDGMAGLTCTQGIAGGRAGLLHALVAVADDGTCGVRIAGQAVPTMRGTLLLAD